MKTELRPTIALICCLFFAQAAYAKEPMNVLFLAVDDLNTWLLNDPNRYTGTVIAPNIKKLASDGMLFERAYCAAPVCSPSRTALLSGVAPWKSGIYCNAQENNDSPAIKAATSLPALFKQHGYFTATAGKISHAYAMPGAWDLELAHTRNPKPPQPNPGFGPIHIPESEMMDTRYADFAIEQLQKIHEQPFFIACGMFRPHGPWYVPQKYFDLYPLDEIVTPVVKENDLDDIPPEGLALARLEKNSGPEDINVWKKRIQAYLASTTYADAQIGRVLNALEQSPYKDNTLVVLWSDHGYHMGEKKRGGKMTLWEEATHSLLMFKVPSVTEPGQVCSRFVSLQDIYPTLAELCALPAPAYLDGNSLRPLLQNPSLEWDKPVITAYMEQWKSTVYLSARTEDYRYIRYREGSEEFYHSAKDPHEWTNQINNPEYKQVIEQHKAMLPEFVEPMPYIPLEKRGYHINQQKK